MAVLAWVSGSACAQLNSTAKQSNSATVLQWSFVGTEALAKNKDLAVFNKFRDLPESTALRNALATNLASMAVSGLQPKGGPNAPAPTGMTEAIAALIQPIVTDLVQHESRFQMDSAKTNNVDWFLAAKIPEDRSSTWSKSLTQLTAFGGLKGANNNPSSWQASGTNYDLKFTRSGEWTILEGGKSVANSKTAEAFREGLKKRADKSVLSVDLNGALLGKLRRATNLSHVPNLALRAEPRDDGFFSELTVDYPQDLGIKPEKWNVPEELIDEPLLGFTAIQGIREKLEASEWFKTLGVKKTPNQLFAWSQKISPFSISIAAEVPNAAEAVTNSARLLQNAKFPAGQLEFPTNRTAAIWTGLPIATPFFAARTNSGKPYLVAGLFTASVRRNPVPKDLFNQLNQKNLVYYDWEITGERIRQGIPTWHLYYLLGGKFIPDNTAPSMQFLQEVRGNIGNTVTTGTLESPRRIRLTRQSHLGASALELLLLAHYIDHADLRPHPGNAQLKAVPGPGAKSSGAAPQR
ncbi:MAG TPA: hypothetical protein VF773_15250 [Verrucomicrobiae bacterium]